MRHLLPALAPLLLAAAPPFPPPEPPLPPPPASLRLGQGDRVLAYHKGGICGVGYSPDGKLVATAGADHMVRLWDAVGGKRLRTFRGHGDFLRLSIFSPDGKLVASGGNGKSIVLWNPATGEEVRRLAGHNGDLYKAIFTRDGKTLISAGFDSHVRVWDVASGKQLRAWTCHQRVVYALALSPDEKLLATGGDQDSTIHLWDWAAGRQVRSWPGHDKCVYHVAFSPDGRWLASGGGDTFAKLWEVATGREVCKLDGHGRNVNKVLFTLDGRILVGAGYTKSILAWDLLSGKELFQLGDHANSAWVWGLTLSPDGKTLISGSADGTAVQWSLPSRVRPPSKPTPLADAERDALWADLAAPQPSQAFRAVYRLAGDPEQAVPLLGKHLKPVAEPKLDAARVARLIGRLDDDNFETREKASAALGELCPQALPELRRALLKPASLEARRRLERLVAKYGRDELSAEELRLLRAIHVLEEAGTPAARALLKSVASGFAEARRTREAAAALARLEKR